MRDLALLGWLRWRHLRGRSQYWLALLGVDLSSRSVIEISYTIYAAALALAWFALMLSAAASQANTVGSDLGARGFAPAAQIMLAAPFVLVLGLSVRALRSAPVKLTSPDIAYVASSSIDTRAIAILGWVREATLVMALAWVLGILLGAAAAGAGAPAAADRLPVVLPLITACASLIAWAGGLARVRVGALYWPGWTRYLPLTLLPAIAVVPPAWRWPGTAVVAALTGGDVTASTLALAGLAGVGVLLVWVTSARLDMPVVIDESVLFAELQVFRPLRLYDAAAYRDIVRRKKLALRPPYGRMGDGSGPLALLARAVASHLRQPRSLVLPLVWGAGILPALSWLAVTNVSPFAYVPAFAVALLGPSGQLVRVFDEDLDRPALRALLPFGNLSLLLLDSAPVIALMSASAVAVWAIIGSGPVVTAAGAVLSLALGVTVVLSRGLERLKVPRLTNPIGSGISMTLVLAFTFLAATDSPVLACATAVACAGTLAVLVHLGRE